MTAPDTGAAVDAGSRFDFPDPRTAERAVGAFRA
jgi:hypothetical protein